MTIFFSYPLTRWLMNERRTLLDWRPLTALALLAGGMVISLWPEFSRQRRVVVHFLAGLVPTLVS